MSVKQKFNNKSMQFRKELQRPKYASGKRNIMASQLNKDSINLRFMQLQEQNPRLKNLINRFSHDPQRKLKSVIMTNQKMNGTPNEQDRYKKGGNSKYKGTYKSTILSNKKNGTRKGKEDSHKKQFKSLFTKDKGQPLIQFKQHDKVRKKNFVKDNRSNAFNIQKSTGFFNSKFGDFKKKNQQDS